MIRAIAHPTDFSREGTAAFMHALRLALLHRSRLYLLHVRSPDEQDAWAAFPHVRETLSVWGMLERDAPVAAIEQQLGIVVHKVEIHDRDPVHGIARFLQEHRCELIVAATHERSGVARWLSGSISEGIARETHTATLFVGSGARTIVDQETGRLEIPRVLLPVAHDLLPGRAVRRLKEVFEPIRPILIPLHVGEVEPVVVGFDDAPLDVMVTQGSIVPNILAVAEQMSASLIAMPTAGHNGWLDAVRGSTTERVLRDAPCPLLALPA